MLTGLQHLHSALRWLVVIVGVIAIIRLVILYVRSSDTFTKGDSNLMRVLTVLVDVQVTVGIIFLIAWAAKGLQIAVFHWEHAVTMLLAAVAVHISARYKSSPPKVRARNTLVLLLIAALLIGVGVARLPQGWELIPGGMV